MGRTLAFTIDRHSCQFPLRSMETCIETTALVCSRAGYGGRHINSATAPHLMLDWRVSDLITRHSQPGNDEGKQNCQAWWRTRAKRCARRDSDAQCRDFAQITFHMTCTFPVTFNSLSPRCSPRASIWARLRRHQAANSQYQRQLPRRRVDPCRQIRSRKRPWLSGAWQV
jgi:hypothetical protein